MTAPLAPEVEPLGHTAIYRLFDEHERLLYVGITNTLLRRIREHAAEKPWWPDVAFRTVTWHEDRADAEGEETNALLTENPAHNAAGPPTRVPQRREPVPGATHCSVVEARRSLSELVEQAYWLKRPAVIERHRIPYAVLVPPAWLDELAAYREKFGALPASPDA